MTRYAGGIRLRRRQTAALHGWRIRVGAIALAIIVAMLAGCISEKTSVPLPTMDALEPGIYEIEVGNSLYPKSCGASIGFQRYLNSEKRLPDRWSGRETIRYAISGVYVYAPDGSTTLSWSGADLKQQFRFTPTEPGTYKLEILKRDFPSRGARLTVDPPDWSKWGEG